MIDPTLADAPLGHEVAYPTRYDPALLFPIPRETNRLTLPFLPQWSGEDVWNAYEVSWLNPKGKPVAAMARFLIPASSPKLVESKSFKLYLNSFNEERFANPDDVLAIMRRDLREACGAPVAAHFLPIDEPTPCAPLEGRSIDGLDIEINVYQPAPGLLRCLPGAKEVTETLVSDLLKSNCPVTGQPDWGSVQIRYTGPRIDEAALLAYIVSLRHHNEFHEHCVEKIYCDLMQACKPSSLFVYARYTRRGGLDINPWRSSEPTQVSHTRTPRQ